MLAKIKFISIVLFLSLLDVQTRETHKCHCHQTYNDECDTQTSKWSRHIRVSHLFADSSKTYDSKQPSKTRTKCIRDSVCYSTNELRVRWCKSNTLLHEERSTHDGTVHGNQRQEDAQRGIERGAETLDSHFHQLRDAGDDGDEKNETQEAEVHTFNNGVRSTRPSKNTCRGRKRISCCPQIWSGRIS